MVASRSPFTRLDRIGSNADKLLGANSLRNGDVHGSVREELQRT